jgi:hypothetical protein
MKLTQDYYTVWKLCMNITESYAACPYSYFTRRGKQKVSEMAATQSTDMRINWKEIFMDYGGSAEFDLVL